MVHLREWRQILFNFIREIRDQNNRGIVVEFSRVGLIDVADVYLYSGNVLFARRTMTAFRIRVSGSYNQQLIRDGVLVRFDRLTVVAPA